MNATNPYTFNGTHERDNHNWQRRNTCACGHPASWHYFTTSATGPAKHWKSCEYCRRISAQRCERFSVLIGPIPVAT